MIITDAPWYYADPQGNVQVSYSYCIALIKVRSLHYVDKVV
jgi:hypothetical protein